MKAAATRAEGIQKLAVGKGWVNVALAVQEFWKGPLLGVVNIAPNPAPIWFFLALTACASPSALSTWETSSGIAQIYACISKFN